MTIAPTLERPRLREIEVTNEIKDGHPYFHLSDPLHLSDRSLLVPQPWGAVLAMLDGMITVDEVANELETRYEVQIESGAIQNLVDALDEIFLLDNDRFVSARQHAVEEFRSEPYRPSLLADQGFAGSADVLRTYLDSYLSATPEPEKRSDLVLAVRERRFGILSPHIDYQRGGRVYAEVWKQAADAVREADLVILLGTDHKGDDAFTLTRQSYATPYGVLPTDLELVDEIASAIGEDQVYAGELRHRGEHSLELPAIWLHHMREGEPVELVPMLVGTLQPYSDMEGAEGGEWQLRTLTERVRAITAGRRVAVVASGDLSHVGPAFGGEPLSTSSRTDVEADDMKLLDHLRTANGAGFLEEVNRSDNQNNVCGVWPIYLMLRLIDATQGEVRGYDSCSADHENTSAVTIGGILFH